MPFFLFYITGTVDFCEGVKSVDGEGHGHLVYLYRSIGCCAT